METKTYNRMLQVAATMNAQPNSFGIIDSAAQQYADHCRVAIMDYLNGDILEMVKAETGNFSSSMIAAVAMQLSMNSEFVARVERRDAKIAAEEAARMARKSAKAAEKRAASKKVAESKASNGFNNSSMNIGDEVSHAQFGNGTVSAMDANTITVNFNGTEKRLMKQFTKLTKI